MVALVFTMRFHDLAPIADRPLDLRLMDEMGGLMIWGTILLFIDSILLILLYERMNGWLGGRQLPRIVLALAIVLTFDQIGFFTALHLLAGVPLAVLYGGWIAKMGAAVVFGLMAAFYLRHVETARMVKGAPRLSDVFDTLTYRRRYEATFDTAGRDRLTGLLDRVRFDSEGRSLVNDAVHGGRSLSLMVIDIDKLGDFNRRHGKAAGDEVLRQVAALVRQATRESDRVYRYGGEEILVLSDGLGHRPALLTADRLRRRVATTLAGGPSPVTATVGIATAPDDGGDLAALLAAADRRLYEGKAAGGDRVVGGPEAGGSANVTPFPRRERI
jgi:diguanylate cyclase (GGDEF)-like protein